MSADKAFIDTSAILRLLLKDDEVKSKAVLRLIRDSGKNNVSLYLPPVTIMEIVWVLEKVYKTERSEIFEIVNAILNTPELKCETEDVFREAIIIYRDKKIKFADAVMGCWGLDKGIHVVYTYDEKDFRKISGLDVRKP